MEVFKDVAAISGCIIGLINLITLCTKAGRNFVKKLFTKNTKDIKETDNQQSKDIKEIKDAVVLLSANMNIVQEALKQECRDKLKDIYYKYCKTKKIPLYERKTADVVYTLYKEKFNGNSYAALLYEEICKWEIDNEAELIIE